MLPFYEKIAAEGDAPEYGPTMSGEQKCGSCRFFRTDDEGAGYCDKYKFICQSNFVCESWEPGEHAKLSSAQALDSVGGSILEKGEGVSTLAGQLAKGNIGPDTLKLLRDKKLLPTNVERSIGVGETAVGAFYPKKKRTKTAAARLKDLVSSIDPMGVEATLAGVQAEQAGVTAKEHRNRRMRAMAEGAVGGGIVAPTLTGIVIGGTKGALKGGPLRRRLAQAATEAGRTTKDLYSRGAAPALAAGGVLAAGGAGKQYDTGRNLAILSDLDRSIKEGSWLSPYVAAPAIIGSGVGLSTALGQRKEMRQDMKALRAGKISPGEYAKRSKDRWGDVAMDAGVGAGVGLAGTAVAKKLAIPFAKKLSDKTTKYVGDKVDEASSAVLKNVDSRLSSHRRETAAAAKELSESQLRRASETDFLRGTRQGLNPLNWFRRSK